MIFVMKETKFSFYEIGNYWKNFLTQLKTSEMIQMIMIISCPRLMKN